MKYILIVNLEAECFNDPKFKIESNNDGDLVFFNSIRQAENYAKNQGFNKYEVYKKVIDKKH